MTTLDTIKQRGADDRVVGLAWEHRPKYTSLSAQIAYMDGWMMCQTSEPEFSAEIGARNRRLMFGDCTAEDWDEAAWSRIVD